MQSRLHTFHWIIFTIEYYGTRVLENNPHFFFSKQTVRLIAENEIWPFSICLFWEWKRRLKHSENCKTLPWKHLIGCQCVKLILLKYFSITTTKFGHSLSFWVLPQFVLSFVNICVFEFGLNLIFEFGHNLSFWVLSFWVFEFGHNLSF